MNEYFIGSLGNDMTCINERKVAFRKKVSIIISVFQLVSICDENENNLKKTSLLNLFTNYSFRISCQKRERRNAKSK